jgi:bacillithiol biosynthesis cysteine-adding enzyme BshC
VPAITQLPYSATYFFSSLIADYLADGATIKPFYQYRPDHEGITQAIEQRKGINTDRRTLVDVLEKQYQHLPEEALVTANITSLLQQNAFTVCTAHQPNLGTGYLYFVYKILHAIKLAQELNEKHPDLHFVPIYYIGSEDNDLDELGTFRYGGKKFVWDAAGQTGAVGRMDTASLKPLLEELFKLLGPPGENLETLKEILTTAYLQHPNIADATQYLVHRLFGKYGLVVINPDEAALKKSFIPVMEDDLLHHSALPFVIRTTEELGKAGYKTQAYPRPINLFYLKDDIRERIEYQDEQWTVINTDISWNKETLLDELYHHPERFSPNVILRGLYQETILPNVVFIGGGAEVAYWMQLRALFQHYKTFYPVILLRQSVLWAGSREVALRKKLNLSPEEVFKPEGELIKQFITSNASEDWTTGCETAFFEKHLTELKHKAGKIDPTLKASTEAVLTKIRYQLQILEKKMLRAEKKNMSMQLEQVSKLKTALFPNNSLQERYDNFMAYYLQHGPAFFETILEGIEPTAGSFMMIEE